MNILPILVNKPKTLNAKIIALFKLTRYIFD
jgi:hypothetical protein